MAIKNNDDVAHLLQAVDGQGVPYREFEGKSDHMSAPLIDAVFGSNPEPPGESSVGIGSAKDGDLLADVFDRPLGGRSSVREGFPREEPLRTNRTNLETTPAVSRRSLNDIRRIIVRPAQDTINPSPAEGLNGLFDRLAG